MTLKHVGFLIMAILFIAFVLQNTQVVEVRFLFWQTEASRALILAGTFALGLVSGWLTRWLPKKGRKATDGINEE